MFNFFFRPYAPGFRVRPHDDVLGFNIDENGSPWRASAWSDGLLPDAAARLYSKTTQADTPYSIGFPTPAPEAVIQTAPLIGLGGFRPSPRADVPGFSVRPWDDVPGFSLNEDGMLSQFPVAEEPSQPAPPQLPGWLYKLATMLPPLLTMLDPLTGRRVAISSPPGMPSTEQPVAGQWPSSGLPQQSADMNIRSRAATMGNINAQPGQSAISNVWPQPRNDSWPYAQLAGRSSPWNTGITRQPLGIPPIPEARPFEGSNSILTDTTGAGGPQARRQTPLRQYQATQPSSSLGTVTPSSNGPSLGQRLVQNSVETIVPGAHYQKLARQQLESGSYIGAGVYQKRPRSSMQRSVQRHSV